MSAQKFGAYVERRMAELGISQNRLASRLGELSDGRVFDATQVRMIREGRRRLDEELVGKLIELLDMDRAEAWHQAGLWPPDLDVAKYRSLMARRPAMPVLATVADATPRRRRSDRPVRAQGKRTTDQPSLWAGQRPALTIIAGEKDQGETGQEAA
jgi:hypothetical protein